MSIDQAVELSRAAIVMALMIGAPVLIAAIAVGLIVSILQAVTQIQDQTLSFVPKIIAMMLVLLWVLPWVLREMVQYSTDLYRNIPAGF